MPEIYLNQINTVAVASAATTADEAYIRQALTEGRLISYAGEDGEALVSLDELRGLQRTDGLRT